MTGQGWACRSSQVLIWDTVKELGISQENTRSIVGWDLKKFDIKKHLGLVDIPVGIFISPSRLSPCNRGPWLPLQQRVKLTLHWMNVVTSPRPCPKTSGNPSAMSSPPSCQHHQPQAAPTPLDRALGRLPLPTRRPYSC